MTVSAALPLVVLGALLLVAACLLVSGLRASARLDLHRSVRIHASPDRVWEVIGRFPDLHARHGKLAGRGRIEAWRVRHGDGTAAGSVWRGTGTLDGIPYWLDVEIVRSVAPRVLELTLVADSRGTERGIRAHRGVLTVEREGSGSAKLNWTLQAHIRGWRTRLLRLVSSARLQALLLDLGLRSIKGNAEKESGVTAADRLPSGPQPTHGARPDAPGPRAPTPPRDSRPPEAAL